MKRKKHGKKKAEKKVLVPFEEPKEDKLAPHSFVITRGIRSRNIVHICRDFRKVMEPYTATHLRERKCNKLRDFVSLSGIFHVSYMCIFSQSTKALSLKFARLPKGPTLSFKVHQYTLAKDVISSLKKQFVDEACFLKPPVVILNGFSGEGQHLKIMAATLQNMFPPINLSTVKLVNLKRVLLFSYNPTTKLIDVRHYAVKLKPVGIDKAVRKLLDKNLPDLSKYQDWDEYFAKAELQSGSELEDADGTVTLAQTVGKGNTKENKSAIKLYEIGPRFTMQLVKIEEGLVGGEVLHHEYFTKSEAEVEELRKRVKKRKKLKEQRKLKMKQNVEAKKKAKESAKKHSMKSEPMDDDDIKQEYDYDEEIKTEDDE